MKSKYFWVSDEKEKYDPSAFRDAILQGIAEAGDSLDQVNNRGSCRGLQQCHESDNL